MVCLDIFEDMVTEHSCVPVVFALQAQAHVAPVLCLLSLSGAAVGFVAFTRVGALKMVQEMS